MANQANTLPSDTNASDADARAAAIAKINAEAAKPIRTLSTAGLIRVAIENRLEAIKGKRVNISGPHYKIVQVVAGHLGGAPENRSYNSRGLKELRVTLSQCLNAVDDAMLLTDETSK